MKLTIKTNFLEELYSLSSELEKLLKLDVKINYFILFPKRKELIYVMEKGLVKLLFDASKYVTNISKSNIIEEEKDEYYFMIGNKEIAKILSKDFEDIDIDIECDVQEYLTEKYANYKIKVTKNSFVIEESGGLSGIFDERIKEMYETIEDGKKYDIIYEGLQIDSSLENHIFDKKSDIGIIFNTEESDFEKVISISQARDLIVEEEFSGIYKDNEIDIRLAEILFVKMQKLFARDKVIIAKDLNTGRMVFKLCSKEEKEQIIVVFGHKEKVNKINIKIGNLVLKANDKNATTLIRSFKRIKPIVNHKLSIKTIPNENKIMIYGYNYLYGIYFEEILNVDKVEKEIRVTLPESFVREMADIKVGEIEIYESGNIISVLVKSRRNIIYHFMTMNEIIFTKSENSEEYEKMKEAMKKIREMEQKMLSEKSKDRKYEASYKNRNYKEIYENYDEEYYEGGEEEYYMEELEEEEEEYYLEEGGEEEGYYRY